MCSRNVVAGIHCVLYYMCSFLNDNKDFEPEASDCLLTTKLINYVITKSTVSVNKVMDNTLKMIQAKVINNISAQALATPFSLQPYKSLPQVFIVRVFLVFTFFDKIINQYLKYIYHCKLHLCICVIHKTVSHFLIHKSFKTDVITVILVI